MRDVVEARIRAARRAPLFDPAGLTPLPGDAALVERLIPHRGSMRLVDGLIGVDVEAGRIAGRFRVAPTTPCWPGISRTTRSIRAPSRSRRWASAACASVR